LPLCQIFSVFWMGMMAPMNRPRAAVPLEIAEYGSREAASMRGEVLKEIKQNPNWRLT